MTDTNNPVSNLSLSTVETYKSCFEKFREWCQNQGYDDRPARAEVVASYLTYRRTHDELVYSSLQQYASAIGWAHRQNQLENPVHKNPVARYLEEVRKEDQNRQKNKATPLRPDQLKRIVNNCGFDPKGLRDRAMFLVCFVAALRNSELRTLSLSEVEERSDAYLLRIVQDGNQKEVYKRVIPRTGNDPSAYNSFREWLLILKEQGINEGPVFRSVSRFGKIKGSITPSGINYALTQRLQEAGLSTTYSVDSLRKGLASAVRPDGTELGNPLVEAIGF